MQLHFGDNGGLIQLSRRLGQRISTEARANITSEFPSTRDIPTAKQEWQASLPNSVLKPCSWFISNQAGQEWGLRVPYPSSMLLCRRWAGRLKSRLKTYAFVLGGLLYRDVDFTFNRPYRSLVSVVLPLLART
jgi:hypothetical protein